MNRQEKLSEVLVGVEKVIEVLYEEGNDSRAILQYMDKILGDKIHDTLQRLDSLNQQQGYSEKEVLVLLHKRDKHSMDKSLTFSSWQTPKEWFEQFKKK